MQNLLLPAKPQAGTFTKVSTMKTVYFIPLLGFVVPTVIIGYGVVIPNSCIAGWNAQSIGFATTILGACATYYAGIGLVLRDRGRGEKGHAPARTHR